MDNCLHASCGLQSRMDRWTLRHAGNRRTIHRMAVPAAFSLLGAISYSLYLLHVRIGGRIINLATRLPESALTTVATVAAVVASVGSAYLLWRFIERPAMAYAQRI